jgi:hypothetical protein
VVCAIIKNSSHISPAERAEQIFLFPKTYGFYSFSISYDYFFILNKRGYTMNKNILYNKCIDTICLVVENIQRQKLPNLEQHTQFLQQLTPYLLTRTADKKRLFFSLLTTLAKPSYLAMQTYLFSS